MTEPGTRIGPFTILGRLGAGGMGEVYLARDSRLDREVALKMLPPALAADSDRLGLFRREALALAALNHPNIATIYGFEQTEDGSLVLVMEKVQGETVADLIDGGSMTPQKGLLVCAQVAEALEAAHERGVIHRDLKPGNVMIGPRGLVKVLDFGLAWRSDDKDAAAIDVAAGSAGYTSPEQVEGDEQDHRTDIFAFGCVLFECLTGGRAFTGDSDLQVMSSVLFDDPDFTRLPEGFENFADLIGRCMAKDPAERLDSIRTARLEIEEALGIRRASALREGEAAEAPPNNLPSGLPAFIGRDGELSACSGLLAKHRLLTLTGVGGCGKTRLALRVAEGALTEFSDGAWFVDFAPIVNPQDLPATLARILSVREEPGRPVVDSLARHLAARRALLILDNCEHLVDACRDLASSLLGSAPDIKILATSREPLGIAVEQVHAVPTLGVPRDGATGVDSVGASESARLFVERAAAVRPGFELDDENAAAVAEICRRLDGIPLAIELAAARVRILSVEQIRAKLDDRFRLLTGGSKSALPRQQTLLSTIQWSWDHLAEAEQQMMRSLAVFSGGWTMGTATAICMEDGDEFEVLDLLTRLVEKSLVVVDRSDSDQSRYRYLETVRHFAAGRLADGPDAAEIRARHTGYFQALAYAAERELTGPRQDTWLKDLEAEHANLLAAFADITAHPDGAEGALRMASALSRFWSAHGHSDTGRRTLEKALQLPGADPMGETRAKALVRAGALVLYQGDYEGALPYVQESLDLSRAQNDRRGVARALSGLCVIAQYRGDYATARSAGEEGCQVYRELGAERGVALSLHNLGYTAQCEGNLEEALGRYQEALSLLRKAGDFGHVALTLADIGTVRMRLGDMTSARDSYLEGLELARSAGSLRETAFVLEGVAEWAHRSGEPARGARLLGAADRVREDISSPALPEGVRAREALLQGLKEALSPEMVEKEIADGRNMDVEAVTRLAADTLGPSAK